VADTIREQIISAFITRMAAWKTVSGFNHNCGASVFRAVQHIDEADVPACVLFPRAEEVTKQYGQNVCDMVLRVEAVAEIGTTNPSVIQEQLLGDVITIMTDPAVSVTNKMTSIVYTAGGPAETPKAEDTTVAVFAEFTVKYNTLTGNPYSQ